VSNYYDITSFCINCTSESLNRGTPVLSDSIIDFYKSHFSLAAISINQIMMETLKSKELVYTLKIRSENCRERIVGYLANNYPRQEFLKQAGYIPFVEICCNSNADRKTRDAINLLDADQKIALERMLAGVIKTQLKLKCGDPKEGEGVKLYFWETSSVSPISISAVLLFLRIFSNLMKIAPSFESICNPKAFFNLVIEQTRFLHEYSDVPESDIVFLGIYLLSDVFRPGTNGFLYGANGPTKYIHRNFSTDNWTYVFSTLRETPKVMDEFISFYHKWINIQNYILNKLIQNYSKEKETK